MDMHVADVAKMLQVSQKTVYRWLSRGKIPAYRLNDQYRFDRDELMRWVVAQKLNAPDELLDEESQSAIAKPEQPLLSSAVARGGVLYRIGGHNRSAVLHEVANLLKLPGQVNREQMHKWLEARERLGSTGIGGGIALPHSRQALIPGLEASSVTICFLDEPVAWEALDGEVVNVLFVLVSQNLKDHVGLLSRIVFALRNEDLRAGLARQASRDELFELIRNAEAAQIAATA